MSERRFDFTGPDHPEHDLSTDADFTNLPRPAPHSADELADQPDPAHVAELNKKSTRQAIMFTLIIIAVSFTVALGLVVAFRLIGGPECTAGEAVWFCSTTQRIIWIITVSVTPIVGMLGSGMILVRKLRSYLRWRPWMGAFWVMVPHCMFWMLQTLLELSNVLNS